MSFVLDGRRFSAAATGMSSSSCLDFDLDKEIRALWTSLPTLLPILCCFDNERSKSKTDSSTFILFFLAPRRSWKKLLSDHTHVFLFTGSLGRLNRFTVVFSCVFQQLQQCKVVKMPKKNKTSDCRAAGVRCPARFHLCSLSSVHEKLPNLL